MQPDLHHAIARRARIVTGARWTTLQVFDADAGLIRVTALSPMRGGQVMEAMTSVSQSFDGWDVRSLAVHPDVNEAHRRVHAGEVVRVHFREVFSGVLPERIVAAAEGATDAHAVLMVPFEVAGRHGGSIGFLTPAPMTVDQQAVAEAFVAQVGAEFAGEHARAEADRRTQDLLRAGRDLLAADERLRHELSLHLHGRVQTSLLAAGFQIDRCQALLDTDPDGAREVLESIRVEIDRLREEEIREVSHLLHPSVIDVALVPALRALGDRYLDRFVTHVTASDALRDLDSAGKNRLVPTLRLTAYRIVEEALANASRHGRPTRVGIDLDIEGANLRVTVDDDGVGFDPAEVERGLGLGAIEYRAADAGGHGQVEAAPGHGARVTVWLPLSPPAATGAPQATAPASAGRRAPRPGG